MWIKGFEVTLQAHVALMWAIRFNNILLDDSDSSLATCKIDM